MRKNRRHSTKSYVMAGQSVRLGGVLVLTVALVIVNMLANSSCGQRMKAIGEKEKLLARLEADRMRESSRWEDMLTSESLDRALLKHGLAMRYPRPDQYVKMRADGHPVPAPANLAILRRRTAMSAPVVRLASVAAPRAPSSTKRRKRR